MWVQTDEEGNNSVFVHDFGTGATGPAPDNFIWEDSPQEDGTLRVSMSRDEQDWEIIIRNRDVKGFERITDNALDDRYPRISGNKIAWMAGEGKTREIFLAVYTCLVPLSPGDGAVLSGPEIATFTWVAIGYDKFKVKFSADPEFPTSGSLAFPPSEGSWLSETSLTPSEESWGTIRTMARTYGVVYWQVEGMSTEGSASYSETWSFTIYEGGVAATTTTGGGGDSGPCFIGTVAFD
jgi:hypothetical protein